MESRRSSKRPASIEAAQKISEICVPKRCRVNAPLADSVVVNINSFVIPGAPVDLFASPTENDDDDKENGVTTTPTEEDDWVTEGAELVVDPHPPHVLRRRATADVSKKLSIAPKPARIACKASPKKEDPTPSVLPPRFARKVKLAMCFTGTSPARVMRKRACRFARAYSA